MALDDKKNVGETNSVKLPKGYYVKGNVVYPIVIGGEPKPAGFVENGVAYEFIVGGKPRPMIDIKF